VTATSTTPTFGLLWSQLLDLGRVGDGGYRRFAWTREDAVLREWFAHQADVRGLDLVTDRVGNQWAWWGDPDSAAAAGRPGVVTGSHLDSVPSGGAFDGPLGVVSAFAAVDMLRQRGHTPDRPLGIVNFLDEEGARFGVACAGSRLLVGSLDADRARGLTDADAVTMASAMRQAGHDPEAVGPDRDALARVGTFIELHVEQGRRLVYEGRPVAVGHSIVPHGRWRLDLAGEANHAGTTALGDRRDPMLKLAAVIAEARAGAERHGCVATVGKVQVEPNGVNAIPSMVRAWLDARGSSADDVRAVVEAVAVAGGASAQEESFTPETRFDPGLSARLARVLGDAPIHPTGAGHDAGVLALAGVPTAMLVVRNPTGVSHSPAEHADEADCLAGVEALASCLADVTGVSPAAEDVAEGERS
jgi:N-carbamoyl-L-amino-acid hydrolase